MRALFLIPGTAARQLQLFPAVAAVAEQLQAQVQVVCPPAVAAWWTLHPAVEKTLAFPFESANLAEWANLLGSVREPDFQLVVNLASGRQVDLMLSMSHIPTRVATGGFSATDTAQPGGGWPAQAMETFLRPIGVSLQADGFRLPVPQADLDAASEALPSGTGPLLLLARSGASGDWPASQWDALPGRIRSHLPDLRVAHTTGSAPAGSPRQQAAQVACADVVLASDPIATELALLLGLPLVALGPTGPLPERQGVQGVGSGGQLGALGTDAVLAALGFA
ncbi:lipopolysaccharide heptosyltransferase family protein [Synechococcus sp. FGCU-3]|nr:lipopolysaccharide heptosyltransferase family protein [Synechococcus sp. FGCU3]